MPMTRIYNTDATKITDQIRVSLTQGLAQVLGADNSIKVTNVTLSRDNLEPVGFQLNIKITVDVYPKDEAPS